MLDGARLDLAKAGGLGEAQEVAALAAIHGKPLLPIRCSQPIALITSRQIDIRQLANQAVNTRYPQ